MKIKMLKELSTWVLNIISMFPARSLIILALTIIGIGVNAISEIPFALHFIIFGIYVLLITAVCYGEG